ALQMPKSRMVTAAWLLALGLTLFSLAVAVFEPPTLLHAVLFAIITIGILKRRAWSAYGAALLLVATRGSYLLLMARNSPLAEIPWADLAFWIGLLLALAFVFYRAGRHLPVQGSRRTWIALAAVVLLFPQIMRPFIIPTGAMEDTLLIGDRILVRPL